MTYWKVDIKTGKLSKTKDFNEFASAKRFHIKTTINSISISTVFLGIDHSFGYGNTPILFETMIFGGEHDEYQERYTTLAKAKKGHQRAVLKVKKLKDILKDL